MKWIREGETVSFCTNAPARPTCDDAFDRYTPDSCFFAGLLAADGCVSTKNRITIELKAIDELLLKAFMEFIGLENTIKYRAMPKITQWRGIYAAIGWKNLSHIRSLEDNFGITKQKSLTLSPPTIHDPDCEFAFFAGLFAGDGHVSGVLGFFRPKTTIIAESPAIRGLQEGIAFSEVHIYTNFG